MLIAVVVVAASSGLLLVPSDIFKAGRGILLVAAQPLVCPGLEIPLQFLILVPASVPLEEKLPLLAPTTWPQTGDPI